MKHQPDCIPHDEAGASGACLCSELCDHDFVFTEDKSEGWCSKCREDYDYEKHGIV